MAMKFFNRWVAEPIHDIVYSMRKIGEKVGIQQPLDAMMFNIEGMVYDILFKQLYDFQIIGMENMIKTGPAVIVSNHQSILDPLFTGLAVFKASHGRQPWQLAKAEIMEDLYLDLFTRMNKGIFIRRGEHDDQAIAECKNRLRMGDLLIIYPEGSINAGNGKIMEFKSGAVRIAHECEVPIIPMATYGIDRVFGKGMKVPSNKGRVRTIIGKPISVDKLVKMKEVSPGISAPDFDKAAAKLQRAVHDLWSDLWADAQTAEKKPPR
jgi:1-acyl-sn-glycerol-3-phosphate acyltransferase